MKNTINYIRQHAAQGAVNVGVLALAVACMTYFFAGTTLFKQAKAADIIPATDGIQQADATTTLDPLLGQVNIFPYSFAPRGWIACEGQLLPISQYSALFSLLGTTYGGDGRTTFGLPDLRGRMVIGEGRGNGLTTRTRGNKLGNESSVLSIGDLPAHNHTMSLKASDEDGEESDPSGQYLGASQSDLHIPSNNALMASDAIVMGNTGGSASFSNMPPSQVLGFYINTVGVFPSR